MSYFYFDIYFDVYIVIINVGGGGGGETTQGSSDSFEYLSSHEIKPCDRPQREINRLANDLIQQDWPEIFHTINVARQIAIHHRAELLQSNQLHSIILGVTKQVKFIFF